MLEKEVGRILMKQFIWILLRLLTKSLMDSLREKLQVFFSNCSRTVLWHAIFFLVVACELLVAACGISFSDQGQNWGPLHWEHRVLGTRSPRKSPSIVLYIVIIYRGLSWWLSSKESACNAGDPGLIPGSERSPGGGPGNPL